MNNYVVAEATFEWQGMFRVLQEVTVVGSYDLLVSSLFCVGVIGTETGTEIQPGTGLGR